MSTKILHIQKFSVFGVRCRFAVILPNNYRYSRFTNMVFSFTVLLLTFSISSAEVFLNDVFCKYEQRIFASLLNSYKHLSENKKSYVWKCCTFLLTLQKDFTIQVSVNLCNGGFGCCGSGMHTPGPSGEYLGVDGNITLTKNPHIHAVHFFVEKRLYYVW